VHIVFVTHAYPRWEGDVAGTFIERLAVALNAREHKVTVLAPADRGRGGPERRGGIDILWVRYAPAQRETLAYRGTMVEESATLSGRLAALSMVMALARPIRRMIKRGTANIVHAHWWVPSGIVAWMARGGPSCPYVVTLHGTDVRILERSKPARAVARRVLRKASAVTAVSSYLAETAGASLGIEADAILVQPMPADLVRFRHQSRGGGGVVTVGRLVAQKRIDVILEAVARLQRHGREVPLTVIGDGPLRGALEEHALRLGITGTTRFLGEVEPGQLSEAIGNADVFAFTAQAEGLGLAAAEAFMLGIPVVATEAGGGVKDIVPKKGAGRVVPDGDPAKFSDAVAELMDDPGARAHAVEAGERLRERFDPDIVAERFDTLYQEASSGRARA
jgi:glycosyltransferase involved in cell wall biosynthesis